jgi:predicted DsbA family dithiol-disulfide isomerase
VPDPGASFKGTYREEAWRRCGQMAEPDGIVFTPWPHTDRYPNWSLPALEAAKCVVRQAPQAFGRVHVALYEAFFTASRNIADPREVERIVAEAGVDTERFVADYRAGVGRDEVLADYKQAAHEGVRSIPTVILPDTGQALVGLADLAQYRAAIQDAARC